MEELKAGRELDVLIAEKIMGLHVIQAQNGDFVLDDGRPQGLRAYSSDIACAWEVVGKLLEHAYTAVQIEGLHYHGYKCTVGVSDGFADTAPMAICLAALKAVSGIEKIRE